MAIAKEVIYTLTCDGCYREYDNYLYLENKSANEIRKMASNECWEYIPGIETVDLCPQCRQPR